MKNRLLRATPTYPRMVVPCSSYTKPEELERITSFLVTKFLLSVLDAQPRCPSTRFTIRPTLSLIPSI
ncbi:uncharacterized protein SEPMUDRAFT_148070 [Sphaerulina musiva SO2202]